MGPEVESTDTVGGPRSLPRATLGSEDESTDSLHLQSKSESQRSWNLTVYCQPRTPLVWEALTFGRANTKLATIMNERRNSRGPSTVSPTKVYCVDCVGSIIKLHAINQVLGPASLA